MIQCGSLTVSFSFQSQSPSIGASPGKIEQRILAFAPRISLKQPTKTTHVNHTIQSAPQSPPPSAHLVSYQLEAPEMDNTPNEKDVRCRIHSTRCEVGATIDRHVRSLHY